MKILKEGVRKLYPTDKTDMAYSLYNSIGEVIEKYDERYYPWEVGKEDIIEALEWAISHWWEDNCGRPLKIKMKE